MSYSSVAAELVLHFFLFSSSYESIPKVHFLRVVFRQEDRYEAHHLDYS